MIHTRTPVRPLTAEEVSIENAYPGELLVNKDTGEITYKKSDGSSISNKNPGVLTIKSTDGAEEPVLTDISSLDLKSDAPTLTLGKVAFSNDYEDLKNKPIIPDTSAFLPTTGGTLTGGINFHDVEGGGWNKEVIGFRSNPDNGYGVGALFGGGGLTIVGGGESASNLYNELTTNGGKSAETEEAYLAADSAAYVVTNVQTMASRKTFIFDTSGNLTVPGFVIGAVKEYTGTISTSWIGSAAPFYQDLTVNGVSPGDKIIMDINFSGAYANDKNYDSNWAGNIYRASCTTANKIRVFSHSKLTVAIPVHFYVSK